MKFTDRILQQWRIDKVRPFISRQARVLDVGSNEGELFLRLGGNLREGMGIDPELKADTSIKGARLIAGFFPRNMPEIEPFDVITMLAVLEHFSASEYADLSHGCARFLKPGGLLLITVPSPTVDYVLAVLKFFRMIDGMSLEQHHGYDVAQTTEIFKKDAFCLKSHSRFQLGLNHLFVFERTDTDIPQ